MGLWVSDFILDRHAEGSSQGSFPAVGLFADISGFTALTESLMQHGRPGAEALAAALRFYFDPLVEAVHIAGGWITGFAGDAFTALFPVQAAPEALQAAAGMHHFFAAHPVRDTAYGSFPFGVKVGLARAEARWNIVRASERRVYACFHGPVMAQCAAAEQLAGKGEVVLDGALYESLASPPRAEPLASGAWRLLPAVPRSAPSSPAARPAVLEVERLFAPEGLDSLPEEGEFRSVASVFAAFERVDAIEPLVLLLHELLERHGGSTLGVDFGDKGVNCLVHFGAPQARGNEIQQAVDFALELRQRAAPLRIRAGLTFGLRYCGFNGGTTRQEFACLGRATNVAARMMVRAPWGELWCSPGVQARVEHLYEWLDRGAHSFKGIALPMQAQAVVRKLEVPGPAFATAELLDRDAVLQSLRLALQPIDAGRFAGVLTVWGEPGIGKSFLLETLRRELEARPNAGHSVLWLQAPCDATLQQAWKPFQSALRSRFDLSLTSGGKASRQSFDQALDTLIGRVRGARPALAEELERLRSVLGALLGLQWPGSLYEQLEPRQRHGNTLQAICAWLEAESTLQRVVLHVEDLHWADPATIEGLERLCRQAGDWPLALLCSSRPVDGGRPRRLALGPAVASWSLELSPLRAEAIRRMAETWLAGTASDALLQLLAERAEGNPFFAEQLLGHLREEQLLEPSEAGWQPKRSDLVLPDSLNLLLVARLDRLASRVKHTVQAGSVLGNEVPLQVLVAMLRDEPDVPRHAGEAEEQGIWQTAGQLRYLFRHLLLRDAAYEMQARARLRQLHRLAAEAVETLHAGTLEPHFAALAHHWEQAAESGPARRYALGAAGEARKTHALAEAQAHFQTYLRLAGEDMSAEAIKARVGLGMVLLEQGHVQAALEELERAAAQARHHDNTAVLATALRGLASVSKRRGHMDTALDLWQTVLQLCRETGDHALECDVLRELAVHHLQRGEPETARTLNSQALEIARRHNDRRAECSILSSCGDVERQDGSPEVALAYREQALSLARQLGVRAIEADALTGLGILHSDQGRTEKSRTCFESAIELYHAIGNRLAMGLGMMNLAWVVDFEQGAFETAAKKFEQVLALFRGEGDRWREATALENLGTVYAEQGELDKAAAAFEECLSIRRTLGAREKEGLVLCLLGGVRWQQGRLEEGRTLVADGLAAARETGQQIDAALCLRQQSAFERHSGVLDAALQKAAEAEALLRAAGRKAELCLSLCELGHLELARGSDATQRLQEAEALARAIGDAPESLLGRAVSRLRRAQQAAEAGQPLFRGELWEELPHGLRRGLA